MPLCLKEARWDSEYLHPANKQFDTHNTQSSPSMHLGSAYFFQNEDMRSRDSQQPAGFTARACVAAEEDGFVVGVRTDCDAGARKMQKRSDVEPHF